MARPHNVLHFLVLHDRLMHKCNCFIVCVAIPTRYTAVRRREIVFTNGDHCTSPQRGDKLTDTHIQATQVLIRRQFPNIDGLQDPVLGEENRFIPNINEGGSRHYQREMRPLLPSALDLPNRLVFHRTHGFHAKVEVFCTCKMPECLDNMIQCDGCEERYTTWLVLD